MWPWEFIVGTKLAPMNKSGQIWENVFLLGFWELSHPPVPQVRVRVKVGVGLIFKFVGGVSGWIDLKVTGTASGI